MHNPDNPYLELLGKTASQRARMLPEIEREQRIRRVRGEAMDKMRAAEEKRRRRGEKRR